MGFVLVGCAVSARQTQKAAILKFLQAGGVLTHYKAEQLCGCTRAAARIYDLRQEGYAINGEKRPYARYWMPGQK